MKLTAATPGVGYETVRSITHAAAIRPAARPANRPATRPPDLPPRPPDMFGARVGKLNSQRVHVPFR